MGTELDEEVEVPATKANRMAVAKCKLTNIAESLAKQKPKAEMLEALLKGCAADASGSGSIGGHRRNAVALKVLQRALKERPKPKHPPSMPSRRDNAGQKDA